MMPLRRRTFISDPTVVLLPHSGAEKFSECSLTKVLQYRITKTRVNWRGEGSDDGMQEQQCWSSLSGYIIIYVKAVVRLPYISRVFRPTRRITPLTHIHKYPAAS
jgi:hypothetical protein